MEIMAVEESQDCSWVVRGWERSLLFVFLSYPSTAASKTDLRLLGMLVTVSVWDMGEKRLVEGCVKCCLYILKACAYALILSIPGTIST